VLAPENNNNRPDMDKRTPKAEATTVLVVLKLRLQQCWLLDGKNDIQRVKIPLQQSLKVSSEIFLDQCKLN